MISGGNEHQSEGEFRFWGSVFTSHDEILKSQVLAECPYAKSTINVICSQSVFSCNIFVLQRCCVRSCGVTWRGDPFISRGAAQVDIIGQHRDLVLKSS